ncbi:hypothetical protein H5410_026917 [Solanum commersonii]|uniref:Uncharacterized protein n=1 Tax=Solanum commersonii TaxID=4109 RepID=A0A9J5YXU8_SOLCO|nr:hypothetical protein H5410_026917 [Solanum commersonii]
MLNNFDKFGFIALLEPFQQVRTINRYRRRLSAPEAFHNTNGKIWLFVNNGLNATLISNSDQQLSLMVQNLGMDFKFTVTIVYAKISCVCVCVCDKENRMNLWDNLYSLSSSMTKPWIVIGDFNVVLNGEEKIWCIPVTAAYIEDLQNCTESFDLSQISFKGSPFTWCNGKAGDNCIFERLDRILQNAKLHNLFSHTEVEHLPRIGSDHAPMLLFCDNKVRKPFKFLMFWAEHKSFMDVVQKNWDLVYFDNPFVDFKRKSKLCGAKKPFENRAVMQKERTEYTTYLRLEEMYWQQKVGHDWFKSGDRNIRFFHSLVKEG